MGEKGSQASCPHMTVLKPMATTVLSPALTAARSLLRAGGSAVTRAVTIILPVNDRFLPGTSDRNGSRAPKAVTVQMVLGPPWEASGRLRAAEELQVAEPGRCTFPVSCRDSSPHRHADGSRTRAALGAGTVGPPAPGCCCPWTGAAACSPG